MCIFIWWLAVPAKTMCWGVASSGKIKHLTMPPPRQCTLTRVYNMREKSNFWKKIIYFKNKINS
jgi:hypothetical protein